MSLACALPRSRYAQGTMTRAPVALACRMTTLALRKPRNEAFGGPQRSFLTAPACDTFRALLGHLRESCPAGKPVVVRTAWLDQDTAGECSRRAERFVIRLNRDLDEQMATDTLLHEWAHALAWNFRLDKLARAGKTSSEEFQSAAHDEAWGCAYSRVWRAYLARISDVQGEHLHG
jgi:hypothetical protein